MSSPRPQNQLNNSVSTTSKIFKGLTLVAGIKALTHLASAQAQSDWDDDDMPLQQTLGFKAQTGHDLLVTGYFGDDYKQHLIKNLCNLINSVVDISNPELVGEWGHPEVKLVAEQGHALDNDTICLMQTIEDSQYHEPSLSARLIIASIVASFVVLGFGLYLLALRTKAAPSNQSENQSLTPPDVESTQHSYGTEEPKEICSPNSISEESEEDENTISLSPRAGR
jgi:hypothetical protein